jgi:hypothetical protein
MKTQGEIEAGVCEGLTARGGAGQTPLDVVRDYPHPATARFLRQAALRGTVAAGRARQPTALVALRRPTGTLQGKPIRHTEEPAP